MRFLFLLVGALALAQCATGEDTRFRVGRSSNAFVIIGVAEAAAHRSPTYTMLWRRLDAAGAFTEYDGGTIFEPQTHMRNSVRVRGVPGEFVMAELRPGVYALDSVYALVRDGAVNYSANGVIAGPERPSFEVRAGEAIYLGIWEVSLADANAVARPWRLDEADLRAALRSGRAVRGQVVTRETQTRAVACEPRRLGSNTLRQVC